MSNHGGVQPNQLQNKKDGWGGGGESFAEAANGNLKSKV